MSPPRISAADELTAAVSAFTAAFEKSARPLLSLWNRAPLSAKIGVPLAAAGTAAGVNLYGKAVGGIDDAKKLTADAQQLVNDKSRQADELANGARSVMAQGEKTFGHVQETSEQARQAMADAQSPEHVSGVMGDAVSHADTTLGKGLWDNAHVAVPAALGFGALAGAAYPGTDEKGRRRGVGGGLLRGLMTAGGGLGGAYLANRFGGDVGLGGENSLARSAAGGGVGALLGHLAGNAF